VDVVAAVAGTASMTASTALPHVVVVKGPRSNDRHWSAAAERTLDALGTWEAIQLDPAAPPEEHTSQAARLDGTLPNVILTPHRHGNTRGARQGVFLAQYREAQRHFAGEPLRYPLRPEMVALFRPT